MRLALFAALSVFVGIVAVPIVLMGGGGAYISAAWAVREWVLASMAGAFLALHQSLRLGAAVLLRVPGRRLEVRTDAPEVDDDDVQALGIKAPRHRTGLAPWVKPATMASGAAAAVAVYGLVFLPQLQRSPQYQRLVAKPTPRFVIISGGHPAEYLKLSVGSGLVSGLPLLSLGLVNALELFGLLRRGRRYRKLPPYPFDPDRVRLVYGEVHKRAGERSEHPSWLIQPEKGMSAGVLVTGATGSGKTEGIVEPFGLQLVHLHAEDRDRKLAGLIVDPKGSLLSQARAWCEAAGRGADFYPITLPEARMNVIDAPLDPFAMAGAIHDAIENIQGGPSTGDHFWSTTAKELIGWTLSLVRLAARRPATLADIYRVSASAERFGEKLQQAEARRAGMRPSERVLLDKISEWYTGTWQQRDPKLRSSISAGVSGTCSLFDSPDLERSFCALPHPWGFGDSRATFPGFDRLIAEGKIVVLSLPTSVHKTVSRVVSTITKLNFQDAVLRRLARSAGHEIRRPVFFLADEYGAYASLGDTDFLSKCRQARCTNIIALQDYSSLAMSLRDRQVQQNFFANLRTKVWFAITDPTTAQKAAELCGKQDVPIESRTETQNDQETAFSFVDRMSISEGRSSATASRNWSYQEKWRVAPWVFQHLHAGEAVVSLFDGDQNLPPWRMYAKSLDTGLNTSWFDSHSE